MSNSTFSIDVDGHAVCGPLKTLEDVWSWSPESFSKLFAELTLKERPTKQQNAQIIKHGTSNRQQNKESQILVCHDMMGGYLKDKYIFGIKEEPSYRFYHWHLIDTFIYFSHEFITIPPLGWIRAAHKEGVTILGTIITEWEDGAKRCEEFLHSASTADNFALKLAKIAKFYGFDGWLINIENKIEQNKVVTLKRFVEELTNKCHENLPHAKVLWYDSVIETGELKWQDELNHHNKIFFDVCDGIFLNYLMTKEKLERSRIVAGENGRQYDVYAGIDVFGRGSPSGGGFNCKQDLAMIRDQNLSCALFATGWVYQHEENRKEDFDTNEIKFWGLMTSLLQPKAVSAPFTSSFCQGYGNQFFVEGQAVDNCCWQDLSLQQIQPCFTLSQFLSEDKSIEDVTKNIEMGVDITDAYQGGSCLRLSFLPVNDSLSALFRIFKVCPNTESTTDLRICVVWKCPNNTDVPFVFVVFVHDTENRFHKIIVYTDQNLTDHQKKYICQEIHVNCGIHLPMAEFNFCCTKSSTNGWKRSSLYFKKDITGKGQVATEITTAFLMLAHLSEKVSVDKKQRAIQLGFIEVSHDDNVRKSEAFDLIKNPTFIEAKVKGTLSQTKLSQIFTPSTFKHELQGDLVAEMIGNSQEKISSEESLKEMKLSSSKKDAIPLYNTSSENCLDLTETVLEDHEQYTICILKWEMPKLPVDYFLIYGIESDNKILLGHSVLNAFVLKYSGKKRYSEYILQPYFH